VVPLEWNTVVRSPGGSEVTSNDLKATVGMAGMLRQSVAAVIPRASQKRR
jgi:hypothetical protein